MITIAGRQFSEVTLLDFEFRAVPGERPEPICMCARELVSGRMHRMFEDELHRHNAAPYPVGPDALLVSYYAPAELGCHEVLGWRHPDYCLDLYAEFRHKTNGRLIPGGRSLLGALAYHGLPAMDGAEKESMRMLAMRGGPWTHREANQLLDYCAEDVEALAALLPRMAEQLDGDRCFLRGAYAKAVARIEHIGIPIDSELLTRLRRNWEPIKKRLVLQLDSAGVFEGVSFRKQRWMDYVAKHGIEWPLLASGVPDLQDSTFRDQALIHPTEVGPYRQLRQILSQLRLEDLAVGRDSRNRTMLSPFGTLTGRNAPSNSRFIFGLPAWLRRLIRPEPGWALAYVDYEQQEFGVAAYHSGDRNMMTAYESGDPYLAFAKQAGALPVDATKESHPSQREVYKTCALGVLYGMGPGTLAGRTRSSIVKAQDMLRHHRTTFPNFWRWSDRICDRAQLDGKIQSAFGWEFHLDERAKFPTLRNFPMQSDGAEMLRLASMFVLENGVRLCAPVHDALLIEAPLSEIEIAVQVTQKAMADASRAVLGGPVLRTEAKLFRDPERFSERRGTEMWGAIMEALEAIEAGCMQFEGCTDATKVVHP